MTDEETADLRALTLEVIDNYNAELVAYTDGSCKAGTTDGGAAAVLTTGSAALPTEIETLKAKGRKFTSSYEEEKAAMILAAEWLATNTAERKLICTDSQSLTQALAMTSNDTTIVLEHLNNIPGKVTIQWVPADVVDDIAVPLSCLRCQLLSHPLQKPCSLWAHSTSCWTISCSDWVLVNLAHCMDGCLNSSWYGISAQVWIGAVLLTSSYS